MKAYQIEIEKTNIAIGIDEDDVDIMKEFDPSNTILQVLHGAIEGTKLQWDDWEKVENMSDSIRAARKQGKKVWIVSEEEQKFLFDRAKSLANIQPGFHPDFYHTIKAIENAKEVTLEEVHSDSG